MNIRILGAHNRESCNTSCTCFLIDNTLAIDAGGLTSNLSVTEQERLTTILITHQHYDHIRDIPFIALNFSLMGICLDVYSTAVVNDAIKSHLLNGELYPKFQELPSIKPTISFNDITPYESQRINGYKVTAIPVNHVDTTVGFQISNQHGDTMFYTADTGPELLDCWKHVSPQLLFIDVTMPNILEDFARQTGHLTPALLEKELIMFHDYKGYLPHIVAVHMDTGYEPQIRKEIDAVAESLDITITIAKEGMQFNI
jgi:phosphoribosyl 1,2-cyclic phosphodiesterase